MKIDIKLIAIVLPILLVGVFIGRYWGVGGMHNNHDASTHEHAEESGGEIDDRDTLIGMKNHMIGEMIANEDYKCCLEKPCIYCIEKSPGHGEGATCKCLEDVMNGVHPCGECIGEILEGHGNRFIAKYFATALAEEVGEDHLDTIKLIVSEKYGVPVGEQI